MFCHVPLPGHPLCHIPPKSIYYAIVRLPGCTPIDRAAYYGHLDIVKFLVSKVDTQINYDRAIRCAQEGLYEGEDDPGVEVVKFLKACAAKK